MSVKVIIGPPASGKTQWLIDRIQQEKQKNGLRKIRVILPEQRHKKKFQERLIAEGGMLGVFLDSFNAFCKDILLESGNYFPSASLPLKHRVLLESIRSVNSFQGLGELSSLIDKSGFISLLHELFRDLQQAGVDPGEIQLRNWKETNQQIGVILDIYQEYLHSLEKTGWLDENYLIPYANKFLAENANVVAKDNLVIIDAFERFTPPQLTFISWLDQQSVPIYISLPLELDTNRLVFRRAETTFAELSTLFPDLEIINCSGNSFIPIPIAELADNFYQTQFKPVDPGNSIQLLEVQSPLQEVQESLRWFKKKIFESSLHSEAQEAIKMSDCALVIPNADIYQPLIRTVAEEFGVSVYFNQSDRLGNHPAIKVLIDLLNLHSQNYPRRMLIDIIRSPYFDLSSLGFSAGDAITLEMVSRFGVIVSSLEKWQQVLDFLTINRTNQNRMEDQDEAEPLNFNLPFGDEAKRLLEAIQQLSMIILPTKNVQQLSEWLDWFEFLLEKLNWKARVSESNQETIVTDLIKTITGLRVSEVEIGQSILSYTEFVSDLIGLFQISTATNDSFSGDAIQVLRVPDMRGHRFSYVAALGLAEGSLPTVEKADPFLTEEFREQFGLELRLDQNQIGQFFQLLTRADHEIFLTRPYLTAKGEGLEASPYWNAIVEITGKDCIRTIRPSEQRQLIDAASLTELLFWAGQNSYDVSKLEDEQIQLSWSGLVQQKQVLESRRKRIPDDKFDGLLNELIHPLIYLIHPENVWSASRLETYIACPMRFWVNYALNIKEQTIPELGLQSWQIGSILHTILEKVYKRAENPAEIDSVLAVLDTVAEEEFQAALELYHFEKDILWEQQQREWVKNLAVAIQELEAEDWIPLAQEQKFGLEDQASLKIQLSNGRILQLHGVIDRVDINEQGQIRVIDYKTGSGHLAKDDLINGTRLQLPLYALAARDALNFGQPAEGFYWALMAQKKSALQLSRFEFDDFIGVEGAFQVLTQHLENAMDGITRADFHPKRPLGGCPDYCSARLWCWRYNPEGWQS